jgi:polyisoprenoid-binding protein YceI
MSLRFIGLTGLIVVLVSGCDNDPTEGKTPAIVTSAQEAKQGAAQPASTTELVSIDSSASKIQFVGAKVTGSHNGSFEELDGTIRLVDGTPSKSEVKLTITMSSLVVEPAKLQGHLLSPDFFDAEKFPKATFESTEIKQGGSDGASHTVTGNLELRGTKKAITFPATITVEGGTVRARAEFAINRKDFGIVYPGAPDDLIKDDVLIELDIRGSAKS